MTHPETTKEARRRTVPGVLLLILVLAACGGGGGSEYAVQRTTETTTSAGRYVLPGEEVFPEGIAYRPETGDFFVGSTTDGTVFRGKVGGGDGSEAEVFLGPGRDGRETAIGMKVDERGRLFIAGGIRAGSSSTMSPHVS